MATNQLFCCTTLVQTNAAANDEAYDRHFNSFFGFAETHHEDPTRSTMETIDTSSKYVEKLAAENNIDLQNLPEEEKEKPKYAILVQEERTVGRIVRASKTFFFMYRSDFPQGEYPVRFAEVQERDLDDGEFNEMVQVREYECKAHGRMYDVIMYRKEDMVRKQKERLMKEKELAPARGRELVRR
ncbi:hypothetical protein LTR85_002736 [Meristemomyces frigidus]|nr:hypothetical protein LTR85_002736 [Meristemomyces frigidus]